MQHPSLGGRMHNVHPDSDEAIRQTDSDAALARFSAVQKGYFSDPFIRPLLPRGAHLQPPRPPLINVGTYVRSEGIDRLVTEWLELSGLDGRQCQIVSMGAGSDTRFWRIAAGPLAKHVAKYIEMDFPENTTKKAMAIRKSKELGTLLGKPEDIKLMNGGTGLQSNIYQLIPTDLRRPPHETMQSALAAPDAHGAPLLSPSLPTLLIFECVLVYMVPEASSALFQWFVNYFANGHEAILGSIVYEMFGLNDPFGKVMLNNLKARNVSLPGAEPYPDKASLPRRFMEHGFTTAQALTLREIRRAYIEASEMERISELEMLDEVEELDLVLEHYAITWGLKIYGSQSRAGWESWGIKRPT